MLTWRICLVVGLGFAVATPAWAAAPPRLGPSTEVTGWSGAIRGLIVATGPHGAGTELIVAGDASEIGVYDVDQRRWARRFPVPGPVTALTLSADGKSLAVAGRGGALRLYDRKSGRLRRTLPGLRAPGAALAFSPRGDRLAVAGARQYLVVYDLSRPSAPPKRYFGHTSWVSAVAFSADGKRLISGGWDRAVRIFDVASRALLRTRFTHPRAVNTLRISARGLIISGGDMRLIAHDPKHLYVRGRASLGPVTSVSLAPARRLLLAGTWWGRIALASVQPTGFRILQRRRGHKDPILAVALSPDGKIAVTADRGGRIRLWPIR